MVTFPILYSTGSCEVNHVDILRISPKDARTLVKEGETRQKLAGYMQRGQ